MITGMESASPKVLRHMKKYSNIQGMRDIFNNIREINNDSETRYPIRILLQLIILTIIVFVLLWAKHNKKLQNYFNRYICRS